MFKRKICLGFFIFVFFLSSVSTALALSEISINENNRPKYVLDEVLVKYKEGQVNLANFGFMSFFREFKTRFSNDLTKDDVLETGNIVVYKIKDGRSVEEVIDEIKKDANVEIAEPNYYSYFSDLGTNDTQKANLWGLDNTGQMIVFDSGASAVGTADADIDMPEAWAVSVGTSDVIVAVIDTGVAYDHPDLIDNMWDGTSCKDENGSAITGGCLHGYNFINNSTNPAPVPPADGTSISRSIAYHGTHLAGTIAAAVNNGAGIAGVGQRTKIMALNCDSDGGVDSICVIKSIDFARQNGAKVINASFTRSSFSASEYAAIESFRNAGGIFVAAAGNEGTNNDGVSSHNYPSDYDLDNIISVAATDNEDQLASFSSYGATSVDVGAPGVSILSSVIYKKDHVENFRTPSTLTADAGSFWGIGDATVSDGDIKILIGDVSGAYPSSYSTGSNYYITSNTIDLSALSSTSTSFNFVTKCDDSGTQSGGVAAGDYMELEVSGDGTNFNSIGKWNDASIAFDGGSCTSSGCTAGFDFIVPSQYLTSNFKYRFNWVTDGSSSTGAGCYIYSLKIVDYPVNGVGAGYDYKNGTSMATPHVVGLAAYLFSVNPLATYTEIRNSILNNGDSIAALSGKTVTGKRINAYNSVLAVAVTTPTTVPGIPTGVGATAGDAQVTLNWTAPSDGGSTILDYQIEYTTSGVGWTLLTTSTGTTKTITGLTNNQEYSFTVSARNTVGTGSTSAVATATPTATTTVPGIPTGVGATAGDAEITLNWTAPSNGGSAITDYQIEYTTSGVGWTIINDGVSTNTTKTLISLINDQEYSFRISAINSVGVGSTSTTVSATPTAAAEDPTVPGIPTGVGATAGDAQVTLNWTAPANNGGSTIIDYKIYYTDTLTGSTFVDTSVGTTKVITSLTNNQEYSFTVGARNSVGIGSTSASVSATPTAVGETTVPGIPTGVGATAGDAQVTLNWTAPSDGGSTIIDYQIEYTTTGVGWTILTTSVGTTKNITSLINDQLYSFRISARNSVGVGATSASVSAISVGETGVSILINNGVFVILAGETSTAVSQITVNNSVNINVGDSGTLSQVQLGEDTVITEINDQDFDANLITGADLDESSVSNLLTDYTARALIQWGIPGVTLEFDKPVIIKIYVGSGYDGQTLSVFRSLSVSSGWTTTGLVSSTCVVANGICSFSTNQASYFTASTYSESIIPTATPTSAPSSSSSSGPPGLPVCTDQVPLTAPNLFQITAGVGKATLYYAPTNFKTTGYSIMYGFTAGDERFGTITGIMNNNEGVQNLMINDLSSGTYYFKVSANNGCASGPWSSWMPVKITGGISSTASATSSGLPRAGNTIPTAAVALMALSSLATSWVLFKK